MADGCGRPSRLAARASAGTTRISVTFFFLGFLTSFFGLLSLAMCDPPLQMDYNRCAQESEGRSRAGAREDAVGQVVRGVLWVRRVGNSPLAPVDARTLWVARSLTS